MTRAVFLGSPPAAIPALAVCLSQLDVVGVVTQPDKPRGRSGDPVPTAVKSAALDWGIEVATPSAPGLGDVITAMRPEVGVVVAYGKLLAPAVLAIPHLGFLNVHFSLLPRWRGAAPVQAAIAAGDTETGVSIMKLDEGLDTGPVLSSRVTPISPLDTGGTLTARLSALGAGLLGDVLVPYVTGEIAGMPQDDAVATRAPRLTKSDARLDPNDAAQMLERAVRAFTPRPGAWLETPEGRLKVHAATASDISSPPMSITVTEGEVRMGTPDGSLVLGRVQPAGKQAMDARAWMNGRRNEPLPVT